MDAALDFLIDRSDLRRTRWQEAPAPTTENLQPGQVLLRIDRFGFSSNNITYAVFGESMAYWKFFPGPEGWGRLPVWGFADVLASRHHDIAEGERVYGYLPMSTHLVVQPARVAATSFMDAMPHRAALP